DNIPIELQRYPHWVCYEKKEKTPPDPKRPWKKNKVPVNARTGRNAASNTPSTWATYDVVRAALQDGEIRGRIVHGPCYALWKADRSDKLRTASDPFVAFDLDDCRDPISGTIAPWAQAIIERINSYTEVSPSGHGVRIFAQGILPGPGGKRGDLEIYD